MARPSPANIREDQVVVDTYVRFSLQEGKWTACLVSELPKNHPELCRRILIPVPVELQVPVVQSVVLDP